jgi:tetraacyldisaccharide 4'-kinase
LADLSFGDSLPVVMTEKDATKCRLLNPGLIHQNFWYLSVEVEISNNFLAAVLSKIGMNVSELKAIGN